MKKISKRKLLIISVVIVFLVPLSITFSKYIYDFINYYIIQADSFFFSSDKLKKGGINYEMNNWGGVGSFDIQFELNNHKNNLLTSDSDVAYEVDYVCSQDLLCSINSTSGVIYTDELTDSFVLTATPQRAFSSGEFVTIDITATSTSPYTKTLSARYKLIVGKEGIDYEIVDKAGQTYLNFIITNSIDSYTCRVATGSYNVGDEISIDEYNSLSPADQANFASAVVTLSFAPATIILDTTNDLLNNSQKTYTLYNGISYVSSVTFNVDAVSTTKIRFYKRNVSANYTYPIVNPTPIITFSAI